MVHVRRMYLIITAEVSKSALSGVSGASTVHVMEVVTMYMRLTVIVIFFSGQ